jgi:hypothetical protein
MKYLVRYRAIDGSAEQDSPYDIYPAGSIYAGTAGPGRVASGRMAAGNPACRNRRKPVFYLYIYYGRLQV